MNKAYWNGHELRGPITMENPVCWRYDGFDTHCFGCLEYSYHITSLPVIQSSGFEGMEAGEVEYETDGDGETEWAFPVGKTPTALSAIPATPKASEGETFEDYMRNARDKFLDVFLSDERSVTLKVAVEDLLICFDQMRNKLQPKASEVSGEDDYELERLYEWIMDEKRKPAQTSFTSGWVRNIAKEVEFRLQPKHYPVCQVCPKCNGQGIVARPPWIPGDVHEWSASTSVSHVCDVCNGSKVIYPAPIPIREAMEAFMAGEKYGKGNYLSTKWDTPTVEPDCRTYFLNKYGVDIDKL